MKLSESRVTGWLSPDGEFIECSYHDHFEAARQIALKLGLVDGIPDEDLMDIGWMKIRILGYLEHGISVDFVKEPATDKQQFYLRQMFEEHRNDFSPTGLSDLYYLGVLDYDEYKELSDK